MRLLGVGPVGVGILPGTKIGGHASTAGVHPLVSMLTFTPREASLHYSVTASRRRRPASQGQRQRDPTAIGLWTRVMR